MKHTHMFEVSKRQNAILLGFAVAAMIAVFCYQVVYGATEGSYQWGYKSGREGYECSNYDADCDNGLGSCDIGAKLSYGIVTPPGVPHLEGSVTNRMACLDGFVNGWKHWCNDDLSLLLNLS